MVQWVRALPLLVQDGVVALVLAVVAVLSLVDRNPEDPKTDVLAYLLAIVGMAGLTWRRTNPLAALVVTTSATVAMAALGYGEAGLPIAALLAFYSVAVYARRRTRLVAFLLLGAAFAILLLRRDSADFHQEDLLANALIFSLVWIVGETIRGRRERLSVAEERAERLERERDAEAREAVSRERLHIAQELHDVVAHAMSVIAVQSGMGAHVIDTQPAEAKKALQAIETTSRSALDELRRMLGVLREEGDRSGSGALAPLAGDIEALVDTVRAAGVPIELRWTGRAADAVPPESVLLNRYRIVQEALTNVLKHAGSASVTVTIVERAGETTVEVVDDGRGLAAAPRPAGTPGGHGLVGMRERVALFGGSFEAGPRPGGGFRVFATLLWSAPSVPSAPHLVEQRR